MVNNTPVEIQIPVFPKAGDSKEFCKWFDQSIEDIKGSDQVHVFYDETYFPTVAFCHVVSVARGCEKPIILVSKYKSTPEVNKDEEELVKLMEDVVEAWSEK